MTLYHADSATHRPLLIYRAVLYFAYNYLDNPLLMWLTEPMLLNAEHSCLYLVAVMTPSYARWSH